MPEHVVYDEQLQPGSALSHGGMVFGWCEWYELYLLQELQDTSGAGLLVAQDGSDGDMLPAHQSV